MIVEIFSEPNIQSTTWIGTIDTDWFNINNWTNGIPNATKAVTIPPATNPCILNIDANAYSVKVLNGGSLTIFSELTVSDVFVSFSTTAIIENTGGLVQLNENITNFGNVRIKRSTTMILNEYGYWGGPVNGSQTLQSFSPNSNPKYFLAYNNGWSYLNASKTFWSASTGFAIISPKGISSIVPTEVSFQFIGVLNNGTYQNNVTTEGNGSYKLLGNPYPSRLNVDKLITNNFGVLNSIGTWPHYHPPTTGISYNSSYGYYSLFGGLSVDELDVTRPTKWIDIGTGFFATILNNGIVTINNDMRFDDNYNITKHRLWLNLTINNNTSFSQTLFGYTETSSNEFNIGYDISGATTTFHLSTIKNNTQYQIQTRQLPFIDTDIFNLSVITSLSGTHRISYGSSDGILGGSQPIYLNDSVLSAKTDLKLSAYTFVTSAATINNRFFISFI